MPAVSTLGDEIRAFYVREGLPAHGGQVGSVDWVRAFGLWVPIPNLANRKQVLPIHDAHHLVTGFDTSEVGEAEIGAWALGAGEGSCLALGYDLAAMTLGFVQAPRRVMDAFLWGRSCCSLYHLEPSVLLAMSTDEARAEARTDRPRRPASSSDSISFGAHLAAGFATPVLLPVLFLLGLLGY